MNLFIFSLIPSACVAAYCDKHIVKMPLELAQLLYFTWIALMGNDAEQQDWRATAPFRKNSTTLRGYADSKGHRRHPICQWMQYSLENYSFAVSFGLPMCAEYTRRYNKTHECQKHLEWFAAYAPTNFSHSGLTPMPQAMPEEYKVREHTGTMHDVVEAYRRYQLATKMYMSRWAYSSPPDWIPIELVNLAAAGLISRPEEPTRRKTKNPDYVAQRVLSYVDEQDVPANELEQFNLNTTDESIELTSNSFSS